MKPPSPPSRILIHAAMVLDGDAVAAAPGAILIERGEIVAAGRPEEVGCPADASLLDHRSAVIIPALVNCHAHLDLTHIGCVPYVGPFVDWIDLVRERRAATPAQIAASVRRGVELSRAGGTAIIGDIAGAGSTVALAELRRSGLAGVSFLEVFGIGRGAPAAIDRLRRAVREEEPEAEGVRLGVQPHAPYSCDRSVFEAAVDLDCPISTHLAETPEELRFVESATGPLAHLLRRIGVWDETIRGSGRHPIDLLADLLSRRLFIAAHVNYAETRHLEMLSRFRTTVAYCPRASAYFGHPRDDQPGHQYLAMLAAGVNVALGTDSILCLDTAERLSVFDEMRFLHARDGADPRSLLKMGTINGARALGFDPHLVMLRPGRVAGLLAVAIEPHHPEPLTAMLESDAAPEWIHGPVAAKNLR